MRLDPVIHGGDGARRAVGADGLAVPVWTPLHDDLIVRVLGGTHGGQAVVREAVLTLGEGAGLECARLQVVRVQHEDRCVELTAQKQILHGEGHGVDRLVAAQLETLLVPYSRKHHLKIENGTCIIYGHSCNCFR